MRPTNPHTSVSRSQRIDAASLASNPALPVVPDVPLPVQGLPAHDSDADIALREAFAEFMQLDVAEGDATQDTINSYYQAVGQWVYWCRQRGLEPSDARRQDVELYRFEMRSRGLTVATRKQKLSIIRRFYDAAVKYNILAVNPAAGVKGGKDLTPPEEKIKTLTEGSLGRVLDSIPRDTLAGKRDRAIIGLMAIHGLRRVEIHRMEHEHLRLDDEHPTVVLMGKGHKRRTIHLRADTVRALQEYIDAKLQTGYVHHGALFVAHGNNARGQGLSRQAMNEISDKYLRLTGLKREGASCHVFRHTHATEAIRNGAKLELVQRSLGHEQISMTMRYVHLIEDYKNNPANFIGVGLQFEEPESTMAETAENDDVFGD
jgi:site-specific recombinase XerD